MEVSFFLLPFNWSILKIYIYIYIIFSIDHVRRIDLVVTEKPSLRGGGNRFSSDLPDTRAKSILPKYQSKGLLDVKSDDGKCFLYACLALLASRDLKDKLGEVEYEKQKKLASTYREYSHMLDMSVVEYPIGVSDLKIIEANNKEVKFNVWVPAGNDI